MVWVVPLSDMKLISHTLTPIEQVVVFGVCKGLVGWSAP